MTPSTDDSRESHLMRGVSNHHLQTMLSRLIRRKVKPDTHWQRLELPGGDFTDLVWSEDPQQARHKPRLVVFHGLESGLNNPYTHDLIEAAQRRGRPGMVMRFRGYNGRPNRLNCIYHSDETEGGTWFLHWLERKFGRISTAAVGYSLGRNALACLLTREGNDISIDVVIIVSASFALEACSYHMDKGFSQVYRRYLLNLLKADASRKLEAYPDSLPMSLAQLKSLRRIRDFDDLITAKIHGFADAIGYYHQRSAIPLLNRIAKPTPITHVKNDPFTNHHVIPKLESLSSQVEYQLTERGSHVGFIGGTMRRPEMQLESRIPD